MQQYFAKLKNGNLFIIDEQDFHHIRDVMRFKDGTEVLVAYQQEVYLCRLVLGSTGCQAEIVEKLPRNPELRTPITLIYGMPKGDKFELVLQKATELGVARIVPLLCERSVVRLEDAKISKKMERWQKILKEASEQSHRSSIPELLEPIEDAEIGSYLSDLNLCGDETKCGQGTTALFELLQKQPRSISIIIGPEGGFSDNEFKVFKDLGFEGISLGNRILRSETAVLYLLSVLDFMLEQQGKSHA